MSVKLEIETQYQVPDVFLSLVQEAADMAVSCEGVQEKAAVHILLCDDARIQEYNREYRGVDRATDVLSFPLISYPGGRTAGSMGKRLMEAYDDELNACMLGDLIISVPRAQEQAERYGHSVRRELAFLTVHGMCHLMGYDHIEEEDRVRMRAREEEILNAIGLSRAVDDTDEQQGVKHG